ncbi:MAG: nitronate monooxygenase [Saprospiraceae bacterium]|jgi:nitronate monooxygenase|nr:nitronate monooxygenase [Saprospiraceae bacterium]
MKAIKNTFTRQLNIRYPIIMAPMFLVSNEAMMQAAIDNGIVGVFPSLNFRKEGELESLIERLHEYKRNHPEGGGNFGVNIIAQNTNPMYKKHLEICVRLKVPFYITSLGFPKEVIDQAHTYGGIVYCDVINLKHAKKVYQAGCDGFIAVGAGAGGHAGPYPLNNLIPALMRAFPDKPVVAAGGVADGQSMLSMLAIGAEAVSVGTRFIATHEATVSQEYKDAIVDAGLEDIVLTTRISGTPCSVINTPYAQKLGYRQNFLERFLNKNPRTKKYFKMLVQFRGVNKLEKAIKPGNYNSLWAAGQSSDAVNEILSCGEIVQKMINELQESKTHLDKTLS